MEKKEKIEATNNWLVVQAARFGDLVQTKRLISSLLHNSNDGCIALDNILEEIGKLLYPEVKIYPFNFHKPFDEKFFHDICDKFSEFQKHDFSEIYNCNFSPLSSTLCRLFPDKRIHGYRAAHNASGSIWKNEWLRIFFQFARMRKIASINLVDVWGWLKPFPISAAEVNPHAKKGGKGLGIVLSGREMRRSLPVPVLARIATACFGVLGKCQVKIFGMKSDQPSARKLLRLLPASMQIKTSDLTGKTTLPELARELEDLDLLLAPDTGTMHLAAHLGVPVMAFFLSSAWCHETGPYGKGHYIWQSVCPCSPCIENAPCPYNTRCLDAYANEDFPRLVTCLLQNKKIELNDGLQLFSAGFDEIGQILILQAGRDAQSESREAARFLVKNFLGLDKNSNFNVYTRDLLQSLAKELFPASEWMLPPWRYC